MFFQWRASRFGVEKFHSGMVPHAGTDTRIWRTVLQLGTELSRLDDVLGSVVDADVGIIWEWSSWWALELEHRPSAELRFVDQLLHYYKPLWRRNISVDILHPEADLSGYRLIVVPNLYLVNDAAASNLARYVNGGGHLVMSFFSGIVDEADRVRLGGYPGAFRDLLGIQIEEFNPLQAGQTVPMQWSAAIRRLCKPFSHRKPMSMHLKWT